MKKIFLLAFIFSSLQCFSQKSKTIEIARSLGVVAKGDIYINEENIPTDTVFYLLGPDNRYNYITEYLILYKGDLAGLYDLLKYSAKFQKEEENGTSEIYKGVHIRVDNYFGKKLIYMYENDGNGYTYLSSIILNKLISKIESWANTNKIALN